MIIVPPLGPDMQILDTRRGNAKVRAMYHMPFLAAHVSRILLSSLVVQCCFRSSDLPGECSIRW